MLPSADRREERTCADHAAERSCCVGVATPKDGWDWGRETIEFEAHVHPQAEPRAAEEECKRRAERGLGGAQQGARHMPMSPHFSVLGDNRNIVQLWLVLKDHAMHAPRASARMCAASSPPRRGSARQRIYAQPRCAAPGLPFLLHGLCLLGVCVPTRTLLLTAMRCGGGAALVAGVKSA